MKEIHQKIHQKKQGYYFCYYPSHRLTLSQYKPSVLPQESSQQHDKAVTDYGKKAEVEISSGDRVILFLQLTFTTGFFNKNI